ARAAPASALPLSERPGGVYPTYKGGVAMTSTNVSCERDGPSCAAWLLGESDQEPDHICPGVMAWSVRHFIEQRAGGDWQATFDGFWPLPAGARAIQEWPTHAEEAATNWALLHSTHENPDIGAFRVRDVPPVDLPRWYFPIV